MKRISISILLVLFSLSSFAKEDTLTFKTEGFHYSLQTSPEIIKMKGYLIDLSINKKKCNENLVLSFHNQILTAFKKIVISETEFHLVEWNQKSYKIAKKSNLGRLLFNLPIILKKTKSKESFLCRKN